MTRARFCVTLVEWVSYNINTRLRIFLVDAIVLRDFILSVQACTCMSVTYPISTSNYKIVAITDWCCNCSLVAYSLYVTMIILSHRCLLYTKVTVSRFMDILYAKSKVCKFYFPQFLDSILNLGKNEFEVHSHDWNKSPYDLQLSGLRFFLEAMGAGISRTRL